LNYILWAFFASIFTWFLTALGSMSVFFFKNVKDKIMNMFLGFSSGIMIAASFFSLLAPAEKLAGNSAWLTLSSGFLSGAILLILSDAILKIKSTCSRTFMLVSSITMHNIPEGLVVGVAFGALKGQEISFINALPALSIAFGIGLQNFPEGAAVSLPLRREGYSPLKSFFLGQLSGVVEPIFSVLGAILVGFFTPLLPFSLSFAAGAMIFVAVKELIPEAEKDGGYLSSFGCISGFAIMMLLDVALS
jgi:ZIP family zinc transporter